MIKINNFLNAIKQLIYKKPNAVAALPGAILFVIILVFGVLLGANRLTINQITLGANPAPEVPVIVTPTVQKAPTDKPIVAITSSPLPAPAVQPKIVVVPAPSSRVDSLTPTSTSTSTPTPAGTATTSSATSAPAATTSYTSTNWSGYVATSGSFSAISASWYVPKPTGNGSTTTADATWVGIGGVTTSDLIQVGTENTVDASGKVSSAIFYELLPSAAQIVTGLVVTPGDLIHAALTGSGSTWTIVATDITTNQAFRTVVSYASSLSSAEWIQEDPSYASGQLIPLDYFGTVNISGGSVTSNGVAMNLASVGVSPITLVDTSGKALATPSGLTSDGAGFSVTRR